MKSLLFTVLLAALVLRLSLFFAIRNNDPRNFRQPDSGVYLLLADNLLKTSLFSSSEKSPYSPEYNRTPAYPVFLSVLKIFGAGDNSIILFQIAMSVGFVFMIMHFCRYFLGLSAQACALAGALVALDIPTIVLANSILTETLATFLLLAGVYFVALYIRTRAITALVPASIMFGLCSLCRPSAMLLPVFIAAALFALKRSFSAKNFTAAIVFLLGYVLVISPWLARNNAIFGGPFLSTISYDNLLYVQAAGVLSVAEKISLEQAADNLLREFNARHADAVKNGTLLTIKKLEGVDAFAVITSHPFYFAANYARSVLNMLLRPIRNDIDIMLGYTRSHGTLEIWGNNEPGGFFSRLLGSTSRFTIILCVFQLLILLAAYSLAGAGVVRGFSGGEPFIAVLFSVIVYFCLVSGAPETYARFRVPIMPFIAILSAAGLENIINRANGRNAV